MIISYSAELLSHLRSSVKAYLERFVEPETLLSSLSLSSFFPFLIQAAASVITMNQMQL